MEFIMGVAGIILIIGLVFLIKSKREKSYLDDNDFMEGTVVEYQNIWRKYYPIITYIDNGENKTIRINKATNMKLMKEGDKIRVANIGNGKLLTDYKVKLSMYYAVVFFISSAIFLVASFLA